jgi:hypothetical protein
LSNNLIRCFPKEVEHISPEQPYRLNHENCAQIISDNPGDISFEPNQILPWISSEENAENRAQNKQLRRSGDTGDICLQHINCHYPIPYSLAYDRQFYFQDLSNKHSNKAHALVHTSPFHI